MKKLLQFLLVTITILIPLEIEGQDEIIIKGKVTDNSGNPLVDANVSIPQESYGSSTDGSGNFIFKLPSDYVVQNVILEIKYIGFISQQKKFQLVTGTNTYNFQMERDVLSL